MASVDYFLKIEGVDGESTDGKHKNEIDVLSWSWGESNSGSGADYGWAWSRKGRHAGLRGDHGGQQGESQTGPGLRIR